MPTTEEIREILDASDLRSKALTLVFLSSGVREGAIELLLVGDYAPLVRDGQIIAGKLIAYAGDPEKYPAYITAEACTALEKYLAYRKQHGEVITCTSPLFREAFDPTAEDHLQRKRVVKKMTAHAIRQHYNRLLRSIGLRTERKRRHEFSVHGFRKYFKTRAEQSGMEPINVETLMGHSIGISDSYYRPTENQLLLDYMKAANALTISQEKQLVNEVERLGLENTEIDVMKKNYVDMKISLDRKDEEVASLTDTVTVLSDQYSALQAEIQRLKR